MNIQEEFWAGGEGDAYTQRCPGDTPSALSFFARALAKAEAPTRIIELGAGSGTNLRALELLYPHAYTLGIDVNTRACEEMQRRGVECRQMTIEQLDNDPVGTFDLVLTKGVLIHLDTEAMIKALNTIMGLADKYVLLAEYYRPSRQPIAYQGRTDLLWGDDFAAELLAQSGQAFHVVDYGFVWRHDPQPQDDITWFLLERN